MRAAVTMLFAAAVGIHCSAPDGTAPAAGSEAPITDEPEAHAGRASAVSANTDDDRDPDPRWGIKAEGSPPTLITTTARGDDDALYAAGTFRGSLVVDDVTLTSKGGDDIFLVRFEPDGRLGWTRAIGSVRAERAPHVTFIDGQVKLIATTDGEVDCGSGAMGKWSGGMFFYCSFGADGAPLGGATFPTGSP
jgi:hypothetical protein